LLEVLRIVDWVGGTGTKPATGKYVGPDGPVDNIADGKNIRGSDGEAGAPGGRGPQAAAGHGVPSVTGGEILGDTFTDNDTWIVYAFDGSAWNAIGSSKGADGDPGAAATIAVNSVTTGAAGSSATVVNSGTESAALLDFTVPRGDAGAPGGKGDKGDTGDNATVTVRNVTTGAPGDGASVTNAGTSQDAVLDFEIPAGVAGADGHTVLPTTGAPSNGTGNNGDLAYDSAARTMYGPKAAGVWPAGIQFAGSTEFNFSSNGVVIANDVFGDYGVGHDLSLPAGNFVGSFAFANAPSAGVTLTLKHITDLTNPAGATTIGTIAFTTGNNVGVFTRAVGLATPYAMAKGTMLSLVNAGAQFPANEFLACVIIPWA
jgi:hypothetical protein